MSRKRNPLGKKTGEITNRRLKQIILEHEEYDTKMQQALEIQGLEEAHEKLLLQFRQHPPGYRISSSENHEKDRAIHYQIRSNLLSKENTRLKKRADDKQTKHLEWIFEGSFGEYCNNIASPSEENQRMLEEAQSRWREKQTQNAKLAYQQLIKGFKISTPQIGEWLSPMPIFSEKEPFGFCQATGIGRNAIRNYLKTIKTKIVVTPPQKVRGRPLNLYSVGTSLSVLDQWLGNWVEQLPEKVGGMALVTFGVTIGRHVQLETPIPGTKHQKKRFHNIIRKHLKRVRDELEAPALVKWTDSILYGPDL